MSYHRVRFPAFYNILGTCIIITSPEEITDHYANILKDLHKKKQTMKTEIRREKKNYHTNHLQTELKAAINQQKNTAPGEDTIHLQMIKNIYHQRHWSTYILDIYNKIWEKGEIPKNLETLHNNPLAEGGKWPKRC